MESHLKGNRPIKSTTEFLLKCYTVVECYMESEKVKYKYGVTELLFEIMQRHLRVCVNYGFVPSKDLFEKVDDLSL